MHPPTRPELAEREMVELFGELGAERPRRDERGRLLKDALGRLPGV